MQNREKDVLYCGVDRKVIETAEPVLNAESLELFKHWIVERYRIHLKKDMMHEPQPWTEDKILANYRFTNVLRTQDRQTQHLLWNISYNDKLSIEDKIINNIFFRYWNLWDSMKILGGPWTISQVMDGSALAGAKKAYEEVTENEIKHGWFTKAFFTSGAKMGIKGVFDIPNYVLGIFWLVKKAIETDVPKRILKAESQQEVFNILKELPGIANFLGYQIFVDCTYIPEFPFSENEFTIAGPGCKKGLNRLFFDTHGMNSEECVFWLRNYMNADIDCKSLMIDLPEEERFLSVMALENCLCEFSKYHRAYFNQGRPKNKYIPTPEELKYGL